MAKWVIPTMKEDAKGTKCPAIEYTDGDGYKYWFLNGKEVTEEEVMGNNTKDNVNNPSHYNQAGVECIDAIKASLGDDY